METGDEKVSLLLKSQIIRVGVAEEEKLKVRTSSAAMLLPKILRFFSVLLLSVTQSVVEASPTLLATVIRSIQQPYGNRFAQYSICPHEELCSRDPLLESSYDAG